MTNKELKDIQDMLDIIHAYLSRPRRDRRNETAKRVVEDYMVKYKSLQRLAPEPEPNWKRFMPSFAWWDKLTS